VRADLPRARHAVGAADAHGRDHVRRRALPAADLAVDQPEVRVLVGADVVLARHVLEPGEQLRDLGLVGHGARSPRGAGMVTRSGSLFLAGSPGSKPTDARAEA